jgi:pSer/pThr/pTyr-binding forkhead associated (FHA) protein
MVWSSSERVRGPLMEAREQRANAVLVRPDGRREPLPARGATIGRSRECDIVVDDPGVSRRHVAVRGGPDGWVVEDLGSTNGSAVNGVALEGARVLASGDQIELGSTTLRFDER